ncbi:AlpA family phage regulatory protein [Xanthomonas campestris pv. raphani]|uniref:helix-turn-helix transcriptional regulator n=1 Tax=Xanthomonas campestris TaxID=339 RepID=UPI002B23D749|nr:AlpA family phage regulatory protein [Xanthomonas campestris]MEA9655600.1 AlpA family phage regulatory protein [Xanthomonas campestris pv. raphani]
MNSTQPQIATPFYFMRAKEVTTTIGVSKSTLYAWAAAGKFPKPVQLPGGGATAWVSTEVTAWMTAAVAARDNEQFQAA